MYTYASPKNFYALAGRLTPWLVAVTALLLSYGLYQALFVAPPDYQQGESVRIIYIHVPSAWMSLFVYVTLAGAAGIGLVWNIKLAELLARVSAPIGASFTLVTLVTGSLWGKPMWGTWWVWDARLTSELILLFLYLGIIALQAAIDDPRRAARAGAVLALVGVVNIPVIHFSVQWWNTLHQPASISSISKLGAPSIHPSMLVPLLVMAVAFTFFYLTLALVRMRSEILEREKNSRWVAALVTTPGMEEVELRREQRPKAAP
jgi:heme exporter protein C